MRPFKREALREVRNSRFRQAVNRLSRQGHMPRLRTDVYDASIPLLNHLASYRLRHEECALKIDGYCAVKICFGNFFCGVGSTNSGVVDQNINTTKVSVPFLDGAAYLVQLRYIELNRQRAAPHSLNRMGQFRPCRRIPESHYHIGTGSCERQRTGPANAAGRTSDKRHVPRKIANRAFGIHARYYKLDFAAGGKTTYHPRRVFPWQGRKDPRGEALGRRP